MEKHSQIKATLILLALIMSFAGRTCPDLNLLFHFQLAHNGCQGPDTFSFTNMSSGTALNQSTFYWYINGKLFDSTTGLNSPKVQIKSNGNYRITLMAKTTQNCWDSIWQYATIVPVPHADFITIADTFCANSPVFFQNSTSDTTKNPVFTWNTDNKNFNSRDLLYTFSNPGIYSLTLTAANKTGCSSQKTKNIYILNGGNPIKFYDDNGLPQNHITWTRCITLTTTPDSFIKIFAVEDTLFNYHIDFGDGSSFSADTLLPLNKGGKIIHTYKKLSEYHFIATSRRTTSSCLNTFYGEVINLRVPTVGIGGPSNGEQNGCIPVIIPFRNTSSTLSGNTQFIWNFGDGKIEIYDSSNNGDTIYHIYNQSVCNVYVTLTAQNQCGSTLSTWGPVNAYDVDKAAVSPSINLCYPDTLATLHIQSNLNCYSGTRYYYWDFGDGSNSGWMSTTLPQSHHFPGPGNYNITFIDSNGCGKDSANTSIHIYMPPRAGFNADTVCLGDHTHFSNTSDIETGNGIINTYSWDFGDHSFSNQQNPEHQFNKEGSHKVKLVVKTDKSCSDEYEDSVWVIESPVPDFSIYPGYTICDSSEIIFKGSIQTVSSPLSSFVVDFGDSVQVHSLDTFHRYKKNGTYSIGLTAFNHAGCSAYISKNVHIYSSPQIQMIADTVCYGEATQLQDKSEGIDNEFIISRNWDFNGDNYPDDSSGNPSFIFPRPGLHYISLEASTEFGCTNKDSFPVWVNANPESDFTMSSGSICAGDPVIFNNLSFDADSFVWDFNDGSTFYVATDTNSVTHVFSNPGNYSIKLKALNHNGCQDIKTRILKVNPNPVAFFTSPDTMGCIPFEISISNFSQYANKYTWLLNDSFKSNKFYMPDTILTQEADSIKITLIAENQFSCHPDTFSRYYYTYAQPVPAFSADKYSGCGPLQVNFTNNTNSANFYRWDFGNGNISNFKDPSECFPASLKQDSVFLVTLYAYNSENCMDSISSAIRVFPKPKADFNLPVQAGCPPLDILLQNNSTPYDTGSISDMHFVWDMGNGQSDSSIHPQVIFNNKGTQSKSYRIRLWAYSEHQCVDSTEKSILVHAKPHVSFYQSAFEACSPAYVNFINTSIPFNGNIYDMHFNWDFAGIFYSTARDTSVPFVFSLSTDTSLIITLRGTDNLGCSDTFHSFLRINPDPVSSFISDTASCGLIHCINNSIANDSSNIPSMHYLWQFDQFKMSSREHDSFFFPASQYKDTSYRISLIATNIYGCRDTSEKTIAIHPKPQLNFTMHPEEDCGTSQVQFLNNSRNLDSLYWDFGDISTSFTSDPLHSYENYSEKTKYYRIRLSGLSPYLCPADTLEKLFKLNPNPRAFFSPNTNAGCSPLPIHLFNQSSFANAYSWDMGNGNYSSQSHPATQYTGSYFQDSIYQISLIARDSNFSCADTMIQNIRVFQTPKANFQSLPDSGCTPLKVNFENQSTGAASCKWIFQNAHTSDSIHPVEIFSNNLDRNMHFTSLLTVITKDGCRDSISRSILVYPKPKALFSTDKMQGCPPLEVNFTNNSRGVDSAFWDFGDAKYSTEYDPKHRYYGTLEDTLYQAKLIIASANDCRDTFVKDIGVFKKVIARFNNMDSGCAPVTLKFSDLSENAHFRLWNFGDGNYSSAENPLHTFQTEGQYSVSLIVSSEAGCTDSMVIEDAVKVWRMPKAEFIADKYYTQIPFLSFQFSSLARNEDKHFWTFGDGSSCTQLHPMHEYPEKTGIYPVILRVSTAHCIDSTIREIIIDPPLPEPAFEAENMEGCEPLTVQFLNKSLYAEKYTWHFGDGKSSEEKNPIHSYSKPGMYNVLLCVENKMGNTSIFQKELIHVFPKPNVDFVLSEPVGYIPHAQIHTMNISVGAENYEWYLNGTYYGDEKEPVFFINRAGNHSVMLIGISEEGCLDTNLKENAFIVEEHGLVNVPNAFTPNNDGKNDIFVPVGFGYDEEDYCLQVFDRWGEKIFETHKPELGWNGTFQGEKCSYGMYYWVLTIKLFSESSKKMDGSVYLMR